MKNIVLVLLCLVCPIVNTVQAGDPSNPRYKMQLDLRNKAANPILSVTYDRIEYRVVASAPETLTAVRVWKAGDYLLYDLTATNVDYSSAYTGAPKTPMSQAEIVDHWSYYVKKWAEVRSMVGLDILSDPAQPTTDRYGKARELIGMQEEQVKAYPVNSVTNFDEHLVITFTTFQDRPVQIVYDSIMNDVAIRVLTKFNYDDELAFLKKAVLDLVATNAPVKLGTTGYSIQFGEGQPSWAPHDEFLESQGTYTAITFSNYAHLTNGLIYAKGQPREPGYYPKKLATRLE